MEIKGTIKQITPTIEVGTKGFKKRTVVVTTNEQYPQDLPIDFVQDKVGILDAYKVGQSVVVGINLRGSEYNGKNYLNAQGWKINHEGVQANTHFATTSQPTQNEPDDLHWL